MREFKNKVVERLLDAPLPGDLVNDIDIQRRFLIPLLYTLQQEAPSPHVYAHPWGHKEPCYPNCSGGTGLVESPQLHGCPKCWESKKSWGTARGYGSSSSDFVVGKEGDCFEVEAQLVTSQTVRQAPLLRQLSPIRRSFSSLVHSRVIALCVIQEGALDPSVAGQMLQDEFVTPVVRTVPALNVSSTVIIVDITHTASDHTFYFSLGPGRYQSRYSGGTKEEVVTLVEADGWRPFGRCGQPGGVVANMWKKGLADIYGNPLELIGIWDETSQSVS